MLKKELEQKVQELQEQIEDLQAQYDDLDGFYAEMEEQNAILQRQLDSSKKEIPLSALVDILHKNQKFEFIDYIETLQMYHMI